MALENTNETNNAAAAVPLPPTEMLFYTYEGNFQLDCEAEILSCELMDNEEDKTEEAGQRRQIKVVLNQTVLHAQGGGQPSDCGTIRLVEKDVHGEREIAVTKVLLDRTTGIASHFGSIRSELAPSVMSWIGAPAKVLVDADRRELFSECHTAGHVVHMAMASADSKTMALPPIKAYHFVDGPYVEYKGKLSAEDRGPLLEKLQQSFAELLESDDETGIQNVSRSEAEEMCNAGNSNEDRYKIKDTFQENETVRIIRVAGMSVPCGGTHVKSTGLLKKRNWGILGFRCKKGIVRVKYGQDWNNGGANG